MSLDQHYNLGMEQEAPEKEEGFYEGELSKCCDAPMSGGVQCIVCGACGLCGGWCDGGKICEDYQNKHYKNAKNKKNN